MHVRFGRFAERYTTLGRYPGEPLTAAPLPGATPHPHRLRTRSRLQISAPPTKAMALPWQLPSIPYEETTAPVTALLSTPTARLLAARGGRMQGGTARATTDTGAGRLDHPLPRRLWFPTLAHCR